MFILIFILFVCVCALSIFSIYKILEIEKDIEILYTNYATELEKSILINMNKGGKIC